MPTPLLARFERAQLEIEHAKILAKAIGEYADEHDGQIPPLPSQVRHDDADRRRGIPCVGGRDSKGSHIRGTRPGSLDHLDAIMRRNGGR